MFIIAYLIFFFLLYYKCKKFDSPMLNFVLLFYSGAALCGILLHFFKTGNPCTIFSFLYQVFVFTCFLRPIIAYGSCEKERKIVLLSDRRFIILAYALIGIQVFSIVFFSGYVYSLLARGDFSQIRSEILTSGEDALGASLGRTIAGTASFFYCYNILLFFYSLAFRKDSRLLLVLLMFSSTSRILHSLTYMGRDGLLFWILSFVFTFFLFKPYLNKDSAKIVKRVFSVFGACAVLLILLISISRFGESEDGMLWSLISYFGQPIDNFAKMFQSNFNQWKGTSALFPLLFGEKPQAASDLLASVDDFEAMFGFKNNVFYSFVGNMYLAWGPIITLIVAVAYSCCMERRLRRRCSSMSTMIILMISAQIVLNNYFYWAYYIRVANLFLFVTPLFVVYCNKSKSGEIISPRI